MGMIAEFREFAMRGSVVDLAVGVVIGAAFGKIVTSLVEDIVMPLLGLAMGGVNFARLALVLAPAYVGSDGKLVPAVLLRYGSFLQSIIDFLLVALVIFLVIRSINALRRRREIVAPPATVPAEIVLLTEIRDTLRAR